MLHSRLLCCCNAMRAAMVHAEGCGRRKGQGRCSRAGAALDRLDLAALAQLGVALAAAAQCVENGDALLAPAVESSPGPMVSGDQSWRARASAFACRCGRTKQLSCRRRCPGSGRSELPVCLRARAEHGTSVPHCSGRGGLNLVPAVGPFAVMMVRRGRNGSDHYGLPP